MAIFTASRMATVTLLVIVGFIAHASCRIHITPPPRPAPSRNTYFISSPNMIVPGLPYEVNVDILNGTSVAVTASLVSTNYNASTLKRDKKTEITATGTFHMGSTGHLTLPISKDFECQDCKLTVNGRGSQVFERSSSVGIKRNRKSAFIQTDKSIYKPGQQVRFRIFAVYTNLELYTGSFGYTITDPKSNLIAVEKDKQSESGVVEGFLNLSDRPPFGTWFINVQTGGIVIGQKEFVVEEYELPRFEVTVELEPFALKSDSKLSGTVKAKYTFGKPVKGLVELMVGPDIGPNQCGVLPQTVNIAFDIDGESTFTMPKSSIDRVSTNPRVKVTAIVKEAATGVRLNGSNTITFYNDLYTMDFTSDTPNVFKPGLPYKAFVQVKSPDGMPPSNPRGKNSITVYPYANYEIKIDEQRKYGVDNFVGTYPLPKFTVDLPTNGIAAIDLDIPNNATTVSMRAEFSGYGKPHASKTVNKMVSESNNFIQLKLKDSNVKSGSNVNFILTGTEALELVTYEILSRGTIIKSGTLNGQGRNSFPFNIDVTAAMGPVATLMTYYARKTGEIVADSIAFNVDDIFVNKVSVEFNKNKTEPHTPIELKVSADAGSNVFLLAVDQSVLLLKSGNDIDPSQVKTKVSDQKQMDSELAMTHSAREVADVFLKAGLMVITDATSLRRKPIRRPYAARRGGYYNSGIAYGVSHDIEMDFAPPGALGMDAPNMIGTPSSTPVARIRKVFPEAWLWTDAAVDASGKTIINTTVPDTITTWIASAFATNRQSGLGVANTKAQVTVSRTFFVSLTYPSTIKRNEKAVIQATVFNYLPMDSIVTVSLQKESGFEPIQISGELEIIGDGSQQRVQVASNSNGVVYFPIVAKEVGVFEIVITAKTAMAADGVKRFITIEPEGAPESHNIAMFLDGSTTESHSFMFPDSTVPGSQELFIGVSGDLIGPSFDNIDNLLAIPMGCGEQNMVRFAPNVYIAKYLKTTGQLTKTVKENIIDKLATGYQRQLTYRRHDFSYSAFGDNDEAGSTWLTAYVLRSFNEAKEFIFIDTSMLIKGIDWMVSRQRSDGSFVELGNVINPNTQGKETGPALTAQCLLAIIQNKNIVDLNCNSDYQCTERKNKWLNSTQKATENLERIKLNSITDPFTLSVVAYALTEAKSMKATRAFRKLRRMATEEGGLMYWNATAISHPQPRPYYSSRTSPVVQSRSVNILVSSYALLSMVSRVQIRQALPVVNWLAKQRNSLGGFVSTQDTTVALQALSAFATKTFNPNTKTSVEFEMNQNQKTEFKIHRGNMLNIQRKQIKDAFLGVSGADYKVGVNSNGNGYSVAEINFNYHVNQIEPSDSFDVSTVLLDDDLNSFNLMICTKWLKDSDTGMVVQEIEIPSGFEPDLSSIGNIASMKRYERKGNVVAIYFDEIAKTSTCYSIFMTRKSKVANAEKNFLKTTRYYNPVEKSTVFYEPKKLRQATICDVCPKCSRSC